jgi:hypothetical protein
MRQAMNVRSILCVIAFACLIALPGGAQTALGDVNGDSAADAIDVQLTINAVLGLDIGDLNADVNNDFVINAVDVQFVINGALGLLGDLFTITPTGGEIEVATSGGAIVSLVFPANAIIGSADIVIKPQEPVAPAWLNISMEPAGLKFRERVEITVTAPDGVTLDESTSLFFGSPDAPLSVPTIVDLNARTVTAFVASLGYLPDSAKQDVDLDANGNVQAATISCESIEWAVEATIRAIGSDITFDLALRLYEQIKGLAGQDCGSASDRVADLIERTGCDAYREWTDFAATTAPLNFGAYRATIDPIVYWAAELQAAGLNCGFDFLNVVTAETDEFLAFYNEERTPPGGVDRDRFDDLREEAQSLYELANQFVSIGLESQAETLTSELLHPVMTGLRETAWTLTQREDDIVYLMSVTRGGFAILIGDDSAIPGITPPYDFPYEDEEIFADIQLSDTALTVQSEDSDLQIMDTINLGAGDGPGRHTNSDQLMVDEDGCITLSGTIPGLACFGSDSLDRLRIYLDDNFVRNVIRPTPRGNFLASNVVLDISDLFSTAGVTFTEGESYNLTVVREFTGESNCTPLLSGPVDYELFNVLLTTSTFQPQEAVTLTGGSLNASGEASVTFNGVTDTTPQQTVSVSHDGSQPFFSGAAEYADWADVSGWTANYDIDLAGIVGLRETLSDKRFVFNVEQGDITAAAGTTNDPTHVQTVEADATLTATFTVVGDPVEATVDIPLAGGGIAFDVDGTASGSLNFSLSGPTNATFINMTASGTREQISQTLNLPAGTYEITFEAHVESTSQGPVTPTKGGGSYGFSQFYWDGISFIIDLPEKGSEIVWEGNDGNFE